MGIAERSSLDVPSELLGQIPVVLCHPLGVCRGRTEVDQNKTATASSLQSVLVTGAKRWVFMRIAMGESMYHT
jgi:hypothetical protein